MNETKQNHKTFDKIYHGTIIIILSAYTLTVMFDGDNFQFFLGFLGWIVYSGYVIFLFAKKIGKINNYTDSIENDRKWEE